MHFYLTVLLFPLYMILVMKAIWDEMKDRDHLEVFFFDGAKMVYNMEWFNETVMERDSLFLTTPDLFR